MRRRLAVLPGLVLALILAAPASAAPPTGLYLALGDSLAVGDGASDMATTAYVPLMADYFAGVPHGDAKLMTNVAVGGETTSTFLGSQLAAAMAAIADPSTDTRVVTLTLGGNDLLDLMNDPSDICLADPTSTDCQELVAYHLGLAASNYPAIMGAIYAALAQEDAAAEQVFVLTVYNPFRGVPGPYAAFSPVVDTVLLGGDLAVDCSTLGSPLTTGLNDIIACTAAFFGATVVDGYGAIGDDALALTHIGDPIFNIHPNDWGYLALAEAHRLAARGAS